MICLFNHRQGFLEKYIINTQSYIIDGSSYYWSHYYCHLIIVQFSPIFFQCNLTSYMSSDSITKCAITQAIDSYAVLKNIGYPTA